MVDKEAAGPKQKQNHKQSQKRAYSHCGPCRLLPCEGADAKKREDNAETQRTQRCGREELGQRMFTARAARRATIVREIKDCSIMPTFAQRERAAVSVGEKAVLVLKARKR